MRHYTPNSDSQMGCAADSRHRTRYASTHNIQDANARSGLLRRSIQYLLVAVAVLAAALPASAQFLSIENHSDWSGTCGQPGNNGCATLPTCTQPSGNSLLDDKYTALVVCELDGSASLGGSGYSSLPLILQEYKFGQATPSDTFFTSTDLHFGKSTVSNQDHVNHAQMLNWLGSSGMKWPSGVGFANEAIHKPAAIVTTGDDTHYGHDTELGQFRMLYEQNTISESTAVPVLPGLGNHDIGGQCYKNNCAQRMFDYVPGHLEGGVGSFDTNSDNYSWDWNGVHYIQLNTWAGDTTVGTNSDGSTYKTHVSGLSWLENDLTNRVGTSGRPVIIFQHFGLDCFSRGNELGDCPGYGNPWWTQSQRQQEWQALEGYNVVAMFSGHIHSTGMYDWNEFGSHLDDFVGGTGGEDPCLNQNSSGPACGGRGSFFAVRVKGNFLDVASLEWISDTSGHILHNGKPYFTNLSPTPEDGMYSQGPSFTEGQLGCRKLINSQFIDLSADSGLVTITQSGNSYVVKNISGATIPGPIALQFAGLDNVNGGQVILTNKAFVDRCSSGGNAYMVPDTGSTGDLKAGASFTFTPSFSASVGNSVNVAVVRYGLSQGASPASVTMYGATSNLPPDGSITVYGAPNEAFTLGNSIQTSTSNWISVTGPSSFNRFGIATLNYKLNRSKLSQDKNATEISFVTVTPNNNPHAEVNVVISLELRAADSITPMTVTPNNGRVASGPVSVSAHLKYTAVADTVDGGTFQATGQMFLTDITNSASPVVLYADNINNACDPGSDPNCPSQPNDTANFPAQTLSNGIHTLQVSYSGDSFYEAAATVPFKVYIGPAKIQMNTIPSGLVLDVAGANVLTPYQNSETLGSTVSLSAQETQYNSNSTARYTFDHWNTLEENNGSTVRSIALPIDNSVEAASAQYKSEYLVKLVVSPAGAGTIAATNMPPDGFYPAGTFEEITARANSGWVFTGFSNAFTGSANPRIFAINKPLTIVANFALIPPVVKWSKPKAILQGMKLGSTQLDASATLSGQPMSGTFLYTPPSGKVLNDGLGQPLAVKFTPLAKGYTPVNGQTTIDVYQPAVGSLGVLPGGVQADPFGLIVTVPVRFANVSSSALNGVKLTGATISGASAGITRPIATITPPVTLPAIQANGSQTVTLIFSGNPGIVGKTVQLNLVGNSLAGHFSVTFNIQIP